MTLSVSIHDFDSLPAPLGTYGSYLTGYGSTALVHLTNTFDKVVHPVLNEAGVGSFSVLLSHPDIALIEFGKVAVITDSVSGRRFGFVIESQRRKVLDAGGGSQQVNVVSGRLLGALLERAVVYPEGGANVSQKQTTRVFNWANPAFDDSAWTAPVARVRQGTNPNANSQYGPPYQDELFPVGWTDPDAYWMFPDVGDWEDTPDLNWYARWKFTLASPGAYILDHAVDNAAILYVDGVNVFEGGGYKQGYEQELDLPAGDHVIAWRVRNAGKLGNNPSSFLATLWSVQDGLRDEVVERTDGAADIVVLDTPTASGALGLYFDIPVPGMTVGEVLDIILTEAQDRGVLESELSWTFDGSEDSNGTSWPVLAEITLKVGDPNLPVLTQLTQTYIDWRMDYDALVLHVFVKGDMGTASGVSFAAGVSVSDLEAEGEG